MKMLDVLRAIDAIAATALITSGVIILYVFLVVWLTGRKNK